MQLAQMEIIITPYTSVGVAGLLFQVTPVEPSLGFIVTALATSAGSMGLGGYPDVTLVDARTKAREMKEAISRGEDRWSQAAAEKSIIAEQMATITFDKSCQRIYPYEVKIS